MSYLSGFQGSNGQMVITADQALLWTDGRYFLQAEKELGPGWQLMKMMVGVPRYYDWLTTNCPAGARIGFDPYLLPGTAAKNRTAAFEKSGLVFVPIEGNLVNAIWTDRPALSTELIYRHPEEFTGATMQDKLALLKPTFEMNKAKYLFTSLLDEIAWILNLRGNDIEYNPVFFAYLLISYSESSFQGTLFVNPEKVAPDLLEYLTTNQVSVLPYSSVSAHLSVLEDPILTDSDELNYALHSLVKSPISATQVITKLKGVKNEREVRGMRDCHVRDGRAVVRYLAWLEAQLKAGRRDLTEWSAALELARFRAEEDHFKGLSFETISAVGANAAVIHYAPHESTAALISPDFIYLLDSGGQYWDGTTDITRTVHFGSPTAREKECYTRVLLGNLDLCRLKWPKGQAGEDMDVLARRWLWAANLDYNHGTGHGVGYFLNVHEGPHGIGKHWNTPLEVGMHVTDEPGYYEEGSFGIRIEDVLVVKQGQGRFLEFENITICPYDKGLLDRNLLSPEDIRYIDLYHERVWTLLSASLGQDQIALEWLRRATSPISS